MLKFNTNTWHYKAFKFWHEDIGECYVPEKTNLCSYFYGVMFGSFMYLFLKSMKTLFLCVYTLVWPILATISLLCGRKGITFSPDGWEPYKPFLTLFGKELHIMQIVAPLATACFAIFLFGDLPVSETILMRSFLFLIVISIPVILTGIFYNVSSISIKEYYRENPDELRKNYITTASSKQELNLFVEVLKAKKQKICPLVEFNDVD